MYPSLSSDGFFFAIVGLVFVLQLGIMIGRVYQIFIQIGAEATARRAAMAATKARYSRTVRRRAIKAVGKFARAMAQRAARGYADTLALASSLRPSGSSVVADDQAA